MNLRYRTFVSAVVAGGLIASVGCARHSPARVEVAVAEQAPATKADGQKPSPAAPGGRFTFPSDQGGVLLREILEPSAGLSSDSEVRLAPRPQPVPSAVAHPELPRTSVPAALPKAANPKASALRPDTPPEGLPLADVQPRPTRRPELHGGSLIRVPSRDVELPPSLPILAVLTVDRVPLQDPTTDESGKAALAATPPARTNNLPFMPRNLPDPFENRETVELRTAPPEEQQPTSGTVRPPKN